MHVQRSQTKITLELIRTISTLDFESDQVIMDKKLLLAEIIEKEFVLRCFIIYINYTKCNMFTFVHTTCKIISLAILTQTKMS